MPDILIRNVPEPIVERLKDRAARHRRSLQRELLAIIEAAVGEPSAPDPARVAAAIRERLAASGRRFSDSAGLVREDRDR